MTTPRFPTLLALLLAVGCRRDLAVSGAGEAGDPSPSTATAAVPAPSTDAAPPAAPPGELVLDHLGDPQFLTADGRALYWIDADSRSLRTWSEGDAGAPRTLGDFTARISDLVQPFSVADGVVLVLTQMDGEPAPRVEQIATKGQSRKVLSNAIPSVLGVAGSDGHVFVALDVDPPQRSMLGEAFEVAPDRKLISLGRTNGPPRALAAQHGALVVASAAGLSRHRPKKAAEILSADDFCGPGMSLGADRVYFTRTTEPSVASLGAGAKAVALPAFAVAIRGRGPALYVGTRASDPVRDGGTLSVARALHEADESMRERRHVRALFRVDMTDGNVTRVATFNPPATSIAVTDHGVYAASPDHDGCIYRLTP